MTLIIKHILLRSMLGVVLALFLMPFTSQIDDLTGIGKTITGFGLATGTKSHFKITQHITDTNSGEVHDVTFGDTQLDFFAILAIIAVLLAAGLSFSEDATGLLSPGVASIACAVFLLILKADVNHDVLKAGFGFITVRWKWGFWLALSAAIAAAVISYLPTKHGIIQQD